MTGINKVVIAADDPAAAGLLWGQVFDVPRRGIEILERLNTPDAKTFLAELAKGEPTARLTKEAKASLERMR